MSTFGEVDSDVSAIFTVSGAVQTKLPPTSFVHLGGAKGRWWWWWRFYFGPSRWTICLHPAPECTWALCRTTRQKTWVFMRPLLASSAYTSLALLTRLWCLVLPSRVTNRWALPDNWSGLGVSCYGGNYDVVGFFCAEVKVTNNINNCVSVRKIKHQNVRWGRFSFTIVVANSLHCFVWHKSSFCHKLSSFTITFFAILLARK